MSKSAGKVSRNHSAVLDMLQEKIPGYHPLMAIADIAIRANARFAGHEDDEMFLQGSRIELDAHKTISKFVEPSLSSVQVKGLTDDSRRVVIEMFEPVSYEQITEPSALENRVTSISETVIVDGLAQLEQGAIHKECVGYTVEEFDFGDDI